MRKGFDAAGKLVEDFTMKTKEGHKNVRSLLDEESS